MIDVAQVILIIEMIILMFIIVVAWIYILSVILVPRFHTVANILTSNVCLVGFIAASFWIVYFALYGFYSSILITSTILCSFIPYFQITCNCLVIYALVMITINRFFVLVYTNKRFFQRQAWSIISSVVQWIVAVIIPLPNFAGLSQVRIYDLLKCWY